ncbi:MULTISPECIES: cytochrome P460 family protein [unclassified Nitrospina]|uniref:cytochrome P460 family protein n=1 Tax=unclassified Nitrospina TaxID=2638683 RepID=UPI003F94A47B
MNRLFAGLLAGAMLFMASPMQAGGDKVDYPDGYRDWTHVKSMVIQPGHPLENPFQGIHHVYANPKAVKGFETGAFPDGSVLVFDLLNYREAGKTLQEEGRKLIGVMQKDGAAFGKTGGWGFEAFAGDSQTKRIVTDGGTGCYACHTAEEGHDFVFSRYRK